MYLYHYELQFKIILKFVSKLLTSVIKKKSFNIAIHMVQLLKGDIRRVQIMYEVSWGTKQKKEKKISNRGIKLMNTISNATAISLRHTNANSKHFYNSGVK